MSDTAWATAFSVALALLCAVVVILVVLVLAVLRHLAYLYERLDPIFRFMPAPSPLRANDPLPSIALFEPGHGNVNVTEYPAAQLLLLVHPGCAPCRELLIENRGDLVAAAEHGWRPVVVVFGGIPAAVQLRTDLGLGTDVLVLADETGRASRNWGINTTPAALVLGPGGRVIRILLSAKGAEIRRILGSPPELNADVPSRTAARAQVGATVTISSIDGGEQS